jgi:hypothetical protein
MFFAFVCTRNEINNRVRRLTMKPAHKGRNAVAASIALLFMSLAANADAATAATSWLIEGTGSGQTEAAAQTDCGETMDSIEENEVNNGTITCPAGTNPVPGNGKIDCSGNDTGGWYCNCSETVTCQQAY